MLGAWLIFGNNAAMAAEENTVAAAGAVADASEAEKIAFSDAGTEADQAERLKTEAEWEDGEPVYDVSFTVRGIEYEYLIREKDGMILEWEIEGRDIGDAVAEESLKDDPEKPEDSAADETEPTWGTDTLIGMERAREISLSDTDLDVSEVTFTKIKFERDRREVTYEIEFYQGRTEYEYTIDAYSGEILEMERD